MKRFIEVLFTSFRRLEMDPLYMGWDLGRFWRGLGRRLCELRRLWRWLLTLMKDELIRIKDNFFSDGRVGLRGRSLSIACGVGGCVRGEGEGGRGKGGIGRFWLCHNEIYLTPSPMALYCCYDPLIGSQFHVDTPLHSIGTT